ncbi:MAG: LTA synthase family protein [Limnohabitans sp.]|nr:LTA synthase family protein [Limnohabitans sp.]
MRLPQISSPHRLLSVLGVGAIFLLLNAAVRLGMVFFSGEWSGLGLGGWLGVFAVGLWYDLAALAYVWPIFALWAWVCTAGGRGRRIHALGFMVLFVLALFGAIFVAASEFVFWNEFGVRFNFIAVDYLIYTREVLGNIRESYPMGWILTGLAVLTAGIGALVWRPLWQQALGPADGFPRRSLQLGIALVLPVLSFTLVGDGPKGWFQNAGARELASNGYYDFWRAFRNNDLNYETFYSTLPAGENLVVTQEMLQRVQATAATREPRATHARVYPKVEKPGAPYNLVLVSMESLGAEFVEALGGEAGLTPNLNRLSREGLFFTATYATGLRTVRGLEALTLSLPPLPGHAIPVRKDNKGFATLGGVLREQGYDTLYLYGGYSPFDNMLDFFGGNDYEVIDRTRIDAKDISHETIWGVADEDLFKLAVRELDARSAKGKPWFAHIMTTSNHRPFTYPDKRINIPSGSGRAGAVKYSDWAVGQFLAEAKRKPWFDRTIFVLVADHTSQGRGRVDLEPKNFRIPFIIYAPKLIAPKRVDVLNSQIDVAPTVLSLMGVGYTSYFMGQDILTEGQLNPRAFMANYLTIGYLRDNRLVQLGPNRKQSVLDANSLTEIPPTDTLSRQVLREAVGQYQYTSQWVSERPRAFFKR